MGRSSQQERACGSRLPRRSTHCRPITPPAPAVVLPDTPRPSAVPSQPPSLAPSHHPSVHPPSRPRSHSARTPAPTPTSPAGQRTQHPPRSLPARCALVFGDSAGRCVGPAVRSRTTTLTTTSSSTTSTTTTTTTTATAAAAAAAHLRHASPRGHAGGHWTAATRGTGRRLARSHGRQGPAAVWLYVP